MLFRNMFDTLWRQLLIVMLRCRTEKVPGSLGEWYEYKGEGHAFMNAGEDIMEAMASAGNPVGSKEAQDLAWKRVFDFYSKHLD